MNQMPTNSVAPTLIGNSRSIREVLELLAKAAEVSVPVLIEGETGTGKELAARWIHALSQRRDNPFVPVHVGILSPELVGSELFGHKKGAFTGATDDRFGRFFEAHGGTLFLDEIATMEDRVQVAFLRVLEEGVFRPLGGTQDESVDVRVVAATNTGLRNIVNAGAFREDLLQRLTVFRVLLPPLRNHLEDLPLLAEHFIAQSATEFNLPVKGITDDAIHCLCAYSWPGNVRELKNAIAQAAIVAGGALIRRRHIPPRISEADTMCSQEESSRTPERNQEIHFETSPDGNPAEAAISASTIHLRMGQPLSEIVAQYIQATLDQMNGNVTRAAKSLEISRKTLRRRLKGVVDEEEG